MDTRGRIFQKLIGMVVLQVIPKPDDDIFLYTNKSISFRHLIINYLKKEVNNMLLFIANNWGQTNGSTYMLKGTHQKQKHFYLVKINY